MPLAERRPAASAFGGRRIAVGFRVSILARRQDPQRCGREATTMRQTHMWACRQRSRILRRISDHSGRDVSPVDADQAAKLGRSVGRRRQRLLDGTEDGTTRVRVLLLVGCSSSSSLILLSPVIDDIDNSDTMLSSFSGWHGRRPCDSNPVKRADARQAR